MQFKAWVKDAVKAQSLDKACPDYSNHNNARNHRYSSMGSSMVELEPHDLMWLLTSFIPLIKNQR